MDKWIPVSERLPGDSGTYLVTVHDGREKRTTFAQYQKKLKNWVMTGARAYWRVKAWMPLPGPYQSEIPTGSERSDKVNCDKAECYNCVNHGYCDYETERARNKE